MTQRITRTWALVPTLVLSMTGVGEAAADQVARARLLYNQRQYDAAIAVAREAVRRPQSAPAATLILARAHLERSRHTADGTDLAAARDALTSIDAARLHPTNRTELIVGWAELFFLDGKPDVAAELFDAALARSDAGQAVTRDRMLDWWAQSLDRMALGHTGTSRERIYSRILSRMERELERVPDSAAVIYWLAAGARGAGDLDRAWQSARAGWIRSRVSVGRAAPVRADLDRLVVDAIIPERARQRSASGDARKAFTEEMQAEWDATKRLWQ
jgi:tetratricopeptide (TPR) repeat protein